VQQAREAARRSQCKNNLKQIGLGIHNYESTYSKFPSSGESTDEIPVANKTVRRFFPVAMHVAILPMMEQGNLYNKWNLNAHYTFGTNALAAQTKIPGYVCPSNGVTGQDPLGYGLTDYMPIAYVDFAANGVRGGGAVGTYVSNVPNVDIAGGLGFCRKIADITDGLSNTALVIEDSGRPTSNGGSYDLTAVDGNGKSVALGGPQVYDPSQLAAAKNQTPYTPGGSFGVPGRWADPDNGSGISGPPNGGLQFINQNKVPNGGPPACLWNINNCGPNDEPFSLHSGGVHAVLGDGSVRFLSDNMDYNNLRRLANPKDGETLGEY
jgi:hypothetical protein